MDETLFHGWGAPSGHEDVALVKRERVLPASGPPLPPIEIDADDLDEAFERLCKRLRLREVV